MKISYKNIPIDIVLCMIWSILLVPISLLNIDGSIRIILGIPFVLFIPGYILIFALFPTWKTDRGIGVIERIGLSFGLSIAIIPLICLILNYTSWGIQLESVLFSIFIFINSAGFIAFYRWTRISPDKRFTISFNLSLLKSQNKPDYALNILIILSVVIACALPIYIIYTPKTGEKFTEFYLVGLDDNSEKYSKNLTNGVTTTRIIEIVNHEYQTVNYTIEIWLINYIQIYNESVNEIQYVRNNMWFMDKINNATVNHTNINIGMKEPLPWRYNYSFNITRIGSFRLTFLLYKTPTNEYVKDKDYINIGEQRINSAYREIHQWVNVIYHTSPKANFTFSPDKPISNNEIYFTSNSTSPESRTIRWEWDFGDNTTSFGEIIGLGFNGIDDYVDCGNDSSLQPINGTIEAWIYPIELNGIKTIFTSAGDFEFRHPRLRLEGNTLTFMLTNNGGWDYHDYKANFQPYTWYHIAVTWDGANVSFYVDGSLKVAQRQGLTPAGNNAHKRIGGYIPPMSPEAFNGSIKDMKIYNRSLNSTEIQNNYNGNVITNGLVSWWKLNDKENIAYDTMGRNNGTIYGTYKINQAIHKYSHPGTYEVKHTITNEYGQINSCLKIIVIT